MIFLWFSYDLPLIIIINRPFKSRGRCFYVLGKAANRSGEGGDGRYDRRPSLSLHQWCRNDEPHMETTASAFVITTRALRLQSASSVLIIQLHTRMPTNGHVDVRKDTTAAPRIQITSSARRALATRVLMEPRVSAMLGTPGVT